LSDFGVRFVFWETGSIGVDLENDDHIYCDDYCQQERKGERKNGEVLDNATIRPFVSVPDPY